MAQHASPAVPSSVIQEIDAWLLHGATMEDAVDRLRSRTVPEGYVFHTWEPG